MHYTVCFLGNVRSPGVKTVLKIERYAQRLTFHIDLFKICHFKKIYENRLILCNVINENVPLD